MKRRSFIGLTAMAAAAVSLPFLNCSAPNPELDKKLAVPETLSQLLDDKTINEIGKAYGNANKDEYSAGKLESLLSGNSGGSSISANTTAGDIHSIMEKNIHDDFTSGKTAILNGWVVSRTEARQCALRSLISSK